MLRGEKYLIQVHTAETSWDQNLNGGHLSPKPAFFPLPHTASPRWPRLTSDLSTVCKAGLAM